MSKARASDAAGADPMHECLTTAMPWQGERQLAAWQPLDLLQHALCPLHVLCVIPLKLQLLPCQVLC